MTVIRESMKILTKRVGGFTYMLYFNDKYVLVSDYKYVV